MLSFQFKTELDPVSLYAAIVSTATAIFAVVQWWRTGPRLQGHAGGNFLAIPDDDETNLYISGTIYNRGSRRTTVTTIGFTGYKNRWMKLLDRPAFNAIIPNPRWVQLPKVLEPGDYFIGATPQQQDLVKRSNEMLLYFMVVYTDGKRPVRFRIKPINVKSATKGP